MPTFIDYFSELSSITCRIIVLLVLLSVTFTSLFASILLDIIGRTCTVGIRSVRFTLRATLKASTSNLGMLITRQLIIGVSKGLFLSILII
jgi:hypothetical protein